MRNVGRASRGFQKRPPAARSRSRLLSQVEGLLPELLLTADNLTDSEARIRRASTAANGNSRSSSSHPIRPRFNSFIDQSSVTNLDQSSVTNLIDQSDIGRSVLRKDSCGSSSSSSNSESVALSECTKCCVVKVEESDDFQKESTVPTVTDIEICIKNFAEDSYSASSVFDSPTEEREFFTLETCEDCVFCLETRDSESKYSAEISLTSPNPRKETYSDSTISFVHEFVRHSESQSTTKTNLQFKNLVHIQKSVKVFSETLAENLIGLQKVEGSRDFAAVDVLPHKETYSVSLGVGIRVSFRIPADEKVEIHSAELVFSRIFLEFLIEILLDLFRRSRNFGGTILQLPLLVLLHK